MDDFILMSKFLSHPFVIAITILLLGKFTLSSIIPDKKQKVIEKYVNIKNLFKNFEFLYNRICNTYAQLLKDLKSNKDAEERKQIFSKTTEEEITKMSLLINDTIPIAFNELDSEIEVYFNDGNLSQAYNNYFKAFEEIHIFLVNELPNYKNIFNKKLSEIEELNFENLKNKEKEFLNALRGAKSVRIILK